MSRLTQDSSKALALATLTLAINFWAWALLSPFASHYTALFALTPAAIAMLLAAPVIIGSLGRIVVGLLADTFGYKKIISLLCFASTIPVIGILIAPSYTYLLLAATLLGIAGTSFAAGVPYISLWFTPQKRGLALGIYGIGNAGTALAGLCTPQLTHWLGYTGVCLLIICLLVATGSIFHLLAPIPPPSSSNHLSPLRRLKISFTNPYAWDMAALYAITFGAFVAFTMYLPVMLTIWYKLEPVDAAARAAGFVIVATIARPVGGWLCDHWSATRTILIILTGVAGLAAIMAFLPNLSLMTTTVFLSMAALLGAGCGAVIGLTSKIVSPEAQGGVVGIVGAIGGLGGFAPPLILGYTFELTSSYSTALLLLAFTVTAILVYTTFRFRTYLIK
jgi:NNP family nitrate/nitrite transporter-like MFS transporter